MVPKPEYGDLHRWKVSIGVLLIFASVAIPWIVLREPFSLLTPVNEIDALTGRSRTYFRIRQCLEIGFSVASVLAAPVFLFFGIRFLRQGITGWSKLQNKSDQVQLADNEVVIEEKAPEADPKLIAEEARIEPALTTQQNPSAPPEIESVLRNLRALEERFGRLLRETLLDLYTVLDSRLIGSTVVDFLLLARERPVPDLIIEIKFMGVPIDRAHVVRIVKEYLRAAESYEFMSDRLPIVHLFLVFQNAPNLGDDETVIREAAHEGKFPMIVHFISRPAFARLKPNDIRQLLGRTKGSGTTWTP